MQLQSLKIVGAGGHPLEGFGLVVAFFTGEL
jgi:hypothetical protein